jgi:hypothetical protein
MASIGNILITASQDTWQKTLEMDRQLTLQFGGNITNATRSTSINITTPKPRVACSLPWLILFTAITLLSLVAAVIGLILTLQIKGPRLAMNFTTVLRESRYSGLGSKGSYMDDGDRLKETRETRIVIGDVGAERDVGHVAISTIGGDGLKGPSALRKGWLYDRDVASHDRVDIRACKCEKEGAKEAVMKRGIAIKGTCFHDSFFLK